jgi:hypothetical protein
MLGIYNAAGLLLMHFILPTDLEMKLEESESDMPSSEKSGLRQDLIYIPALDSDRDAEILKSGRLPSYLKESLRFERSTAARFMNTLHKKLDRQAKRSA